MTGGEERVPWVYTCAMTTIADLRQKLQDERDGAEEALKAKDEEIAALRLTVANQDNLISELQLRCSDLESEADGYRASLGPADYEGV